ncbi:hypothetical protein K413DRAFT_4623 [Clostridium sp. ASBs410]|nr:hypothetical protein K413DRAFT_4623 [Clostridium sp. ASBs410]
MKKPQVNTINTDIKNLSIYLRSTKKFGKTTLFRDMILEKYGDPTRGLLVGCGNEIGYKMLDNLNVVQISTYKDMVELKDWLINEKGKEHNIEIVAFDTGDELALIADKETIRQSNLENPNKKCKSVKAAMGGYTAGEKYSANDIIKPYMSELQLAGFGTWVIAHTKFKQIKEKGGLEEDGYMQLTSNLGADYEAAFGDIFDVTLTGVIDRDFEEKKVGDKVKKYSTDTIRKLYFRGTPIIDAGGRFADDAVPEYMVFDKPNMAHEFIKIVEDGMEKSKTLLNGKKTKVSEKVNKKKEEKVVEETAPFEEENLDIDDVIVGDNSGTNTEEIESDYPEDLIGTIRTMFKECSDSSTKSKVKEMISEHGKLNDVPESDLKKIYDVLK